VYAVRCLFVSAWYWYCPSIEENSKLVQNVKHQIILPSPPLLATIEVNNQHGGKKGRRGREGIRKVKKKID
jgi:hypothetical protein